jgi:hypothetical protein
MPWGGNNFDSPVFKAIERDAHKRREGIIEHLQAAKKATHSALRTITTGTHTNAAARIEVLLQLRTYLSNRSEALNQIDSELETRCKYITGLANDLAKKGKVANLKDTQLAQGEIEKFKGIWYHKLYDILSNFKASVSLAEPVIVDSNPAHQVVHTGGGTPGVFLAYNRHRDKINEKLGAAFIAINTAVLSITSASHVFSDLRLGVLQQLHKYLTNRSHYSYQFGEGLLQRSTYIKELAELLAKQNKAEDLSDTLDDTKVSGFKGRFTQELYDIVSTFRRSIGLEKQVVQDSPRGVAHGSITMSTFKRVTEAGEGSAKDDGLTPHFR